MNIVIGVTVNSPVLQAGPAGIGPPGAGGDWPGRAAAPGRVATAGRALVSRGARTLMTDPWQFRGGSVVATDAAGPAAQAGYKAVKHAITGRKDICK